MLAGHSSMSNEVPTMANDVPAVGCAPQIGVILRVSARSLSPAACRLTCPDVTSHASGRPDALLLLGKRPRVSLHLWRAHRGALNACTPKSLKQKAPQI